MVNVPEYSIVVPDLHSRRIGEVLGALRCQEGVDIASYEILVVGRDRYGLVRGHMAEDQRILFLESERDLNPAEARNRGIRAAQGRLIFFIDADCIAEPQWMATLLKAYHEGNPVVGGPMWFRKDTYWILSDNVAHFHDLLPDIGRGPNRHYMLASANLMAEKVILEKVGMFDEDLSTGEDFNLSLKIRRSGYSLYFEPDARIIHRPVRDSPGAVVRHSASWARSSIRIRAAYREELKSPWFLFHPMALRTLSPLIAGLVTTKIFLKHPCVRRYWYTAPVVFLTKMVWCWSAAREVSAGSHGRPI
ncbi:MAG: glycosyltransferase [Nitrospirae bacterium]|nr:glycosyltransferase [Nitrospirota bacterium]